MTAPSTFVATGTWTEPDASASVGTVSFRSVDSRFKNNSNIIEKFEVTVTLDGAGKINNTTGITLVQATNGYTVTENLVGHNPKTYAIAGTGNISLTPSHTTMTVTGTWYTDDNVLAAGVIELKDVDTGDIYDVPLSSGTISKVLFKNTGGYDVIERITGRSRFPSYNIPGNASLNLTTV